MSYIKRTLRAADAPQDMINRLDSLALGYIVVNQTPEQVDNDLYDAIAKNNSLLAAEIALELGKIIIEPANSNYVIKCFDKLELYNAQDKQLISYHDKINHIFYDIFKLALNAQLERKGYYIFSPRAENINQIQFDDDISDRYQFDIISGRQSDEYLILTCLAKDELAEVLTSSCYPITFEAFFQTYVGDFQVMIISADQITKISIQPNLKLNLSSTHEFYEKISPIHVAILMK